MTLESTDLLLSPCGDLKVENGDVVLTTGADLIRQLWLTRVRAFKGDWVLDVDSGVPYIQEVFAKSTGERRLVEIFRDVTLETPGVLAVQSVSVGDIDILTRKVEITVEAVIEGPESATFSFDGTLGIDACSAEGYENLPKTIDGLRIWFDAQDLANLTYASPDINMVNKAGVGDADGVNDVVLQGVSQLGNKRSLSFVSDLDKYMEIKDTQAIRHGAGEISIFIVMKHLAKPSYSGPENMGLISLDGYDGAFEYYNLFYQVDGDVAGTGKLVIESIKSAAVADSQTSTASVENFDSHVFQFDIDSSEDLRMYADGSPVFGPTYFGDTVKLNGDGFIGASQQVTAHGVTEKYFNGNIGEVIVYDRSLDDIERASITSFLQEKWGI